MSKIKLIFKYGCGMLEQEARVGSRLANSIRKTGITTQNFSKCKYRLECGECMVIDPAGIMGNPGSEEEILLMSKGAPTNSRCSCQVVVLPTFENQIIGLLPSTN